MSRTSVILSPTTEIIFGLDIAIGRFIDIRDDRVDDGDEGYLVQWCDKFGFMQNNLKMEWKDLTNHRLVIQKVNEYIKGD